MSKNFLTRWWTGKQAPPPRPPSPVSAKILRISGRGNCKEAIFTLENKFSDAKIAPSPAYTPPGTIEMRKGFGPLALSYDFFDSLKRFRSAFGAAFIVSI